MTSTSPDIDLTMTVYEAMKARIIAERVAEERALRSARARAGWVWRREREAAR